MSYGLKYQTQFSSQTDANNASITYTLQFLFKDYAGGVSSITGSDTTVVQKCTLDDPFAPVKGQSLEIKLINSGNIPLTSFYSDEDDGVQVILKDENDNIKFIGFIVHDDSFEEMVDFSHVISLSANDSLGLLKGVILNQALVRRSFLSAMTTDGDNSTVYLNVLDTAFYLVAGDILEIQGLTYTVVTAVYGQLIVGGRVYNWTVGVTPATPGISYTIEPIYLTGHLNLVNKNSLLAYIAVCLYNTNIDLITNIFCNINAYPQEITKSHFEQTLINGQLFINGETYDNCYDVLTKIMETFRCSLFQANGQWNIVHWEEMRFYANNAVPGFQYDEAFGLIGTTVFNNNFYIGAAPQLTRPIYPLTGGAYRPYKFVRKQFDYNTPKYLLNNYDLQLLGPLLRTYTVGTETISEYVATDWLSTFGSPSVERFIRVVHDNILDRESDRYLVLRGDTYDSIRCLPSNNIECQEGDKIRFSCSFRSNYDFSIAAFSFAIYLTDGTLNYYLNDNGNYPPNWLGIFGFTYTFESGASPADWHSMDTEISQGMPVSGLMDIFLPQFTPAPQGTTKECHYKDLRFEYIPYVNDSTKVIGHIHLNNIDKNRKNNTDVTLRIDNSPRNNISGTLFQPTVTNLIQDRTTIWGYNYDIMNAFINLGRMITAEELRWRQQLRSKLEGGFIGLYQNNCISLLTIGKTDFAITKNYVPGLLTIDYKKNQFNCTLWEIWDEAEPDLDSDYTFTYIYSTT